MRENIENYVSDKRHDEYIKNSYKSMIQGQITQIFKGVKYLN